MSALQLTTNNCGSSVPLAKGCISLNLTFVLPRAIETACPVVQVKVCCPSAGNDIM